MFRVDVRGAKQILSQLPRLVARDLPNAEARKLAARLRTVGGVVHVCGSGQKPDFDAVDAAPPSPSFEAPAASRADPKRGPTERASAERASAERAHAERGAERTAHERVLPERAIERSVAERAAPPTASANDSAAHAARAAQDAAMAIWPEDGTPCTWEVSESTPPLVPRPVRHSAARVAWTLVTVLTIVGGAAGAFWASFGKDVLAVSIAEAHVAPQRHHEQPASATAAPAGSRFALAQELAGATTGDAFRALVARVKSALDHEPEPLRIENQVVGASFELREPAVQSQLEELYPEVHAAGATLLRHVKGSRVGIDRLALLPTTDTATIVRVLGTRGPALDNEAIVTWLAALHAARPLRLLGAGEDFVEGRYDVPMPDGAQLEGDVYTCPGTPVRPKGTGDLAGALESIRKGERFSCQW